MRAAERNIMKDHFPKLTSHTVGNFDSRLLAVFYHLVMALMGVRSNREFVEILLIALIVHFLRGSSSGFSPL